MGKVQVGCGGVYQGGERVNERCTCGKVWQCVEKVSCMAKVKNRRKCEYYDRVGML